MAATKNYLISETKEKEKRREQKEEEHTSIKKGDAKLGRLFRGDGEEQASHMRNRTHG